MIASTYVGSKVQLGYSRTHPLCDRPQPLIPTQSHHGSWADSSLSDQKPHRRYVNAIICQQPCCVVVAPSVSPTTVRGLRPIEKRDQCVAPSPWIRPSGSFLHTVPSKKSLEFETPQETWRRSVGNHAHGAPVREKVTMLLDCS